MKLHTRAATGILLAASVAAAQAEVHKTSWGKTSKGEPVDLYTITGGPLTVSITNYGAHVVSIEAPDAHGHTADVVLGYKDLAGYLADTKTYMGSVVGRYGNRIAKATFSLEGKTFHIPANDHGNALHGGTVGFDQKVWTGHAIPNGVELTLVSPDGDMGFPGTLTAHVRYTVQGSSLRIDYSATTDKPTVLNLTNHSYFNLAGEGSGTILDHQIMIAADRITPVDSLLIPTGQLAPVAGTPFDFRQPHAIGERIQTPNDQLKIAGGYDHNFVLNGAASPAHAATSSMHVAAKVTEPKSGRTLTVTTTEPGVQFYSGNFLDGSLHGRSGAAYPKYAGFCLETQHFPDSPNHPAFPSTELKPGQTLHSTTVFTFGTNTTAHKAAK